MDAVNLNNQGKVNSKVKCVFLPITMSQKQLVFHGIHRVYAWIPPIEKGLLFLSLFGLPCHALIFDECSSLAERSRQRIVKLNKGCRGVYSPAHIFSPRGREHSLAACHQTHIHTAPADQKEHQRKVSFLTVCHEAPRFFAFGSLFQKNNKHDAGDF